MRRPTILLLIAVVALATACGADSTGGGTTSAPEATAVVPTGDGTNPTSTASPAPTLAPKPRGVDAKLESNLYQAVLLADEGLSAADIAGRLATLRFDGDQVLIELTLDEVTQADVAAVEAAGLTISGEFPDLLQVTGSAPVGSLLDLAALDFVVSIAPQFGATTN